LHRIVGPLTQILNEVIADAKLQGLLTLTEPGNVRACIVDSLTGPTSAISDIIRHRRLSSDADQHKGNQADPLRFNVALTQARKSTWVWMEKTHFWHGCVARCHTTTRCARWRRECPSFHPQDIRCDLGNEHPVCVH
jgi:hypothetical protein